MESINQNQTDLLLFQAVKAGDESAFEILFKLYYALLCRHCLSIVKDNMIAEELVSDFLLKVWENRSTITIDTTVKGYFLYAVRNASLNHLQSNKRPMEGIDSISLYLQASAQSPLENLISEEIFEEWEQKIGKLPNQRQKVFRMNKLEGKNLQEIAEELSLSEKTVRNHVQLAIRSLSKMTIIFLLSYH